MSLRTGRLQQTLNSVQASESESPLSSLVEGVDLLSRIDRDELRLPRAGEDLNRIRPVPLTGPLADHICFGDESIQDRFSDKIGSYTRFISDGLITLGLWRSQPPFPERVSKGRRQSDGSAKRN